MYSRPKHPVVAVVVVVVAAAVAATGKYRRGDMTPFVPVSLRLYRHGHAGPVVSVMLDL